MHEWDHVKLLIRVCLLRNKRNSGNMDLEILIQAIILEILIQAIILWHWFLMIYMPVISSR